MGCKLWRRHFGSLPWLLVLTCAASVLGVQQTSNPRIIEHPEDQYFAKNEPATLNCKAEGDPPPIITWYRNGQPVITANENPSSHRMLLPSGQLFFLRIIHNKNNKPDVGVYYCNATNPETRVSVISRNATLDIAVMRDDFREEPRNTEVAVGETAELNCKGPRSLPEPRIKWNKDGEVIRPDGRITIQDGGNLVVKDTKKEDSGIYTCVAHNIAGQRESTPARLSVREKPKFVKAPQDKQVKEDEHVIFQCQASGDSPLTIIWTREDGAIPQGRSTILDDKSLKISKVKVQDQGHYICRAENSVGSVEARAQLSVHSPPSFTVTPRDKVVGVGRTVSFRCEVTGSPPPAVFWNNQKSSQVLMFPRQDLGRFSVTDDGTLVIEPVRKEDAGEYVCQAISVAGSAYAKASLEVKDVDPRPPPIIHQGPQNQTLPINSVAMLQCMASGDPPPTIRWMKNNRILTLGDPRFALLDTGTLQISDLRRMDTGMYTCKAISETGETAWSAALIVEAPSNPTVIFHRTPEPSTFPGAPSKPSLSDITETSVRLSWKSNPNHGASPIFAYTVEYFSHETAEGWVVASDSITEQSYVVRNLRPDTAYMFLVRAQNSHGLSLPSMVTAAVRTHGGVHPKVKPTVPQLDIALVREKLAGQIVEMKRPEVLRSTAIKLEWDVKRAARFIEGFHIKYRVMPDAKDSRNSNSRRPNWTVETVDNPSTRMYVLINLEEYTWYEFCVQPFYMAVEGQESNTVHTQTFEAAPSAAPSEIKVSLMDNNTAWITWSPPPKEHQNGILEGYKIYMFGNESKFNREIKTNASATSAVVQHLVRGMNYRVQLVAYNRLGDSVKSKPLFLGQDDPYKHSIVSEPWFIGTLIGVIGGTLWFALCVFSIWLYRKRRGRKKLHKNGVMSVPVHKSEDPSRLGTLFNPLSTPHYLQKDMTQSDGMRPDVTNVGQGSGVMEEKEPLYNAPSISQPPMKTFYNKHALARQQQEQNVAPYATTTLAMGNNLSNAQPESAFRPIQTGFGPQGSGSSDNFAKNCDMLSSDSNNLADLPHEHLINSGYDPGLLSPMSEYSMADEDPAQRCLLPPGMKQPVLFLPPPPEHPPPSDIGTPPDSPTHPRRCSPGHYSDRSGSAIYQSIPSHPGSIRGGTPDVINGNYGPRSSYSDTERAVNMPYYPIHPMSGTMPGAPHYGGRTHSPPGHHPRPSSPKFQTMAPRPHKSHTQPQDARAYSPRAMSEPENRGPTPPVRGYKLVPIRDNCDPHRHYSDTEGVPTPPLRMMMPHSPPSPAPEDPTMDRGIQSSLPSLASECLGHHDRLMHNELDRPDSPGSEGDPYHEESDMGHSPESSAMDDPDGTVAGSMLASWASVTDHSDTNCSSVRSSSSDGSFFAEADFASAVAKAAELSGLTVVGSTVIDPAKEAARDSREKVKKSARQRQRAKRPTSPYSTDSNYSAVPPHRPYPKSERKRQLQEHGRRHLGGSGGRAPPVRAKPQIPPHVSDLPSYNKPSFPSPAGSMPGSSERRGPRNGLPSPTARTPDSQTTENTVRNNPLAAFDTRDTPIV